MAYDADGNFIPDGGQQGFPDPGSAGDANGQNSPNALQIGGGGQSSGKPGDIITIPSKNPLGGADTHMMVLPDGRQVPYDAATYRDIFLGQGKGGSGGANITVAAGGQQVSPLVEVSPYLPGYSVNRSATPVRGPYGLIQPGQMVGPDGQPVDNATAQQLMQQASVRQRQNLQSPDQQALTQQQIAESQANIKAKQAETTIAQGNLQFLQQKQQFEESIGAAADARATQQQVFSQQSSVAGLQLQMQTMINQHNDLQAQLQSQTDQFNTKQQFDVQQANAQNAEQKQARLQSLASDIATAAKDPGDRGRLASLILANSGWGQQDQAEATTDLRTNDSLMPLNALLGQRSDVMARPDNPYTYTPIATPQLAGLDLSRITMPQAGAPISAAQYPQQVTSPASTGGGPIGTDNLMPTHPTNTGSSGADGSAGGSLGVVNGQAVWAPTGSSAPGPTNEDRGGNASGPILVGERGIELGLPDGKGGMVFLNQQQAAQHGLDLHALSAMKSPQAPQNFDQGGVFDPNSSTTSAGDGTSIFGNLGGQDTSAARSFLDLSSLNARAGTPWQGNGVLPTPVYASSPGFSPVVAQLLAGLRAQQSGLPADVFMQQAQALTPAGVTDRPVGRGA